MTNTERRSIRPSHMTECECGAWVSFENAFYCDDGPTLCERCKPSWAEIEAQKAEKNGEKLSEHTRFWLAQVKARRIEAKISALEFSKELDARTKGIDG